MRTATVEIYSDTTNVSIIRHPDRQFPGLLIQGDTLNNLARAALAVSKSADGRLSDDEAFEAKELAEELASLLEHYKSVLAENKISLPF